jgi:hypothetical protein
MKTQYSSILVLSAFALALPAARAAEYLFNNSTNNEVGIAPPRVAADMPPALTSVVSRMTHGSAGFFDLVLPQPPASPGVECRRGDGTSGTYRLIFSFENDLVSVENASVTSGTGSISSSMLGPAANQYTVNLAGVPSGQFITVTLHNAQDSTLATGDVSGIMGVLVGDVSGNGVVSNTDVSLEKGQHAAPVTQSNFRVDVTVNGVISDTDRSLIKSQIGSTLP